MKGIRYAEEQIIGVLWEAGAKMAALARKHGGNVMAPRWIGP